MKVSVFILVYSYLFGKVGSILKIIKLLGESTIRIVPTKDFVNECR